MVEEEINPNQGYVTENHLLFDFLTKMISFVSLPREITGRDEQVVLPRARAPFLKKTLETSPRSASSELSSESLRIVCRPFSTQKEPRTKSKGKSSIHHIDIVVELLFFSFHHRLLRFQSKINSFAFQNEGNVLI